MDVVRAVGDAEGDDEGVRFFTSTVW